MKVDCDRIIATAAEYIRSDIESYCNNFPPLKWPLTIEQLMKDEEYHPNINDNISEEFIQIQ